MPANEDMKTVDEAVAVVYKDSCGSLELAKYDGVFDVAVLRADGRKEHLGFFHNSRVAAGASAQANNMCGSQVAPFNYLALSANNLTIANADTTLAGEIATVGLGRALASFGGYTAQGALGGTCSFTLTHTFTATGSATVQSIALFNASSAGTMFSEANITSATLASGDSIAVTYTITT